MLGFFIRFRPLSYLPCNRRSKKAAHVRHFLFCFQLLVQQSKKTGQQWQHHPQPPDPILFKGLAHLLASAIPQPNPNAGSICSLPMAGPLGHRRSESPCRVPDPAGLAGQSRWFSAQNTKLLWEAASWSFCFLFQCLMFPCFYPVGYFVT